MVSYYDCASAIESSARQNIWMACESKTFKDEAAGMEDSYIARGDLGGKSSKSDGSPPLEVVL